MLGFFFLLLGSQWGLYVNPALVCMFQINSSGLVCFFVFFRKRNYPDLQWDNWPVKSDSEGKYGRKKKGKSGLKWKGSLSKKARGSTPCPPSPWRQFIQASSSPSKAVPNLYHPCPTLLAIISDFRKVPLPWPHLATLLLPVPGEQLETHLGIRTEKWRVFSMQKSSLLFLAFI